MTLIYNYSPNQQKIFNIINEYYCEMVPFVKRIKKKNLIIPLLIFKSFEWGIYRWYKTPVRRFYGIKSNELIYMITNKCNEKCPKCGIWKKQESDIQHIDVSYFINCLNRLHHNLYQVTITGGEPLLFKDNIMAIAREANKLNVPMVTITNGVEIDEVFLKNYAQLGHFLFISVESINKNKWNEFRGTNSFDNVMPKILLAQKILGDKCRIQSVIAKESINEVQEVIKFCNATDIKHNVQLYQDFGGHWTALDNDDIDNNVFCSARKNICIYPNGDVFKCFYHFKIPLAMKPLGNIVKDDIIEILCSQRSTEISRIMKTCNLPCKNLSCNKQQSLL